MSAITATLIHDAISNPTEVIKQRLQMRNSPYKSVAHCARMVYRTEGMGAFYRSYVTQLCMNVPYQAIHFSTYEFFQNLVSILIVFLCLWWFCCCCFCARTQHSSIDAKSNRARNTIKWADLSNLKYTGTSSKARITNLLTTCVLFSKKPSTTVFHRTLLEIDDLVIGWKVTCKTSCFYC